MFEISLHRNLCCTALAALLFACTTPSPPGRHDERPDAAQLSFISHAYVGGPSVTTQQLSQTLDGPDGPLQIRLLVPRQAENYPLVIYLPGLGDAIDSGELWCKAWAAAGFAVLSVLDRQDGMPLLASEKGRRGDIAGMVAEANTDARRATRVKELLFALAAAREAKDPLFGHIDFSRVTLAGFDTGAFAVLAFSGELQGPVPENAIPGLKAVIAISPVLPDNFVAKGRYDKAGLPVLVVSSDADFDDYGLVTDLGMRVAPFHAMAKNDKYLVAFKRVTHRQLSGDFSAAPGNEMGEARHKGVGASGSGRSRGRGPGGGGPGGGGADGGRQGGQERMPEGPGSGRKLPGERGDDVSQVAMRSISLAFLQSYVRDDAAALDWLSLDAPRWLRPYGSLTIK